LLIFETAPFFCKHSVYYISTVNTQHMQGPDVTTGLYLATCFGR